jgi:uncharacterized membrane protein HdeD (DUF308 family)
LNGYGSVFAYADWTSFRANLRGTTMETILVRNWSTLAFRGLLAILFGAALFLLQTLDLRIVTLLFGFYVLADGICTLTLAVYSRDDYESSWLPFLAGLAGIVTEMVAFGWQSITPSGLLSLFGAWAIVVGLIELATGLQLRETAQAKWLLLGTGLTSLLFGAAAIMRPGSGVLTAILPMAIYLLALGILTMLLAFKLRARCHYAQFIRVV